MKKSAYVKPRIEVIPVITENILASFSRDHTGGPGGRNVPTYKGFEDESTDCDESEAIAN